MQVDKQPLSILYLEDNRKDFDIAISTLKAAGITCDCDLVDSGSDFLKKLKRGTYDLILCDYTIPGYSGADALKAVLQLRPLIPVIIVSGTIGEEQAIDMMKQGATDYVLKNRLSKLAPAIDRAMAETKIKKKRKQSELDLRESEEKYRQIVENANDGIEITQRDEIVFANQRFADMLGYSTKEIEKVHFSKIFTEQSIKDLSESQKLREAGKPWSSSYEASFYKKDGSIIDVDIKSQIIDFQGEPATIGIIRDITERKQAEEALLQNQQRYEKAQSMGHVGNWEYDPVTTNFWGSDEAKRIYGFELESKDFTSEKVESCIPERERVHQALIYLLEEDKKYDLEFDILTHDKGIRKTIQSIAEIERDVVGNPIKITGFISDVTERKQAEDALTKSNDLLLSIIENTPIRVFWKDLELRYLGCNSAFAHDAGMSHPEDLLGKDDFQMGWSEQAELYRADDKLVMESDRPKIGYEEPQSTNDGQTIWLRSSKVPLHDVKGKVIGLIGIYEDITERKLAEEALKESEKKYRTLFTTMEQGVVYQDSEGNIISANQAAERILGLSLDQMLGRTSMNPEWRFVGEDMLELPGDKHPAMIALKTGKTIKNFLQGIYNPELKDYVWILVNATPQFDKGSKTPCQVYSTFTDITARINSENASLEAESARLSLEAQLRQSQKLEAVGTMAGGIAHDFNNILQGLYLYSGIIKDQLKDSDDELKSNFKHIIESSKRAKELVKQILTFGRKEDTDLKSSKIQYLLKDVLKLIRASTPSSIEISENIDIHCGPVLCDSTQLHQVFVNLCNNAVHAMAENGGTLTVSLKEVEAQIEIEPGKVSEHELGVVELIVADTGHGIDAKTLELIFDPFFTTKGVGEGTGLGLSIVHGIIKDMRGQITVESKPGQGTTFRILMPISNAEPIEEELEEPDVEVESLRILFVDDDKMISGAGKMILEQKGHKVTVAENGHKALELFQKDMQAYDLIITDLTMPKMTGLELGKAIRKLSKDVSILLTSGNLDPHLQSEYESLGFNGFVRKPWAAQEMLKTIGTL